jgi:hypothetical protein
MQEADLDPDLDLDLDLPGGRSYRDPGLDPGQR